MANVLYVLTWNRTMKPIVILLSKGEGVMREMVGINLAKVCCKHIWECHKGPPPLYN
jgi:hypothetical protein